MNRRKTKGNLNIFAICSVSVFCGDTFFMFRLCILFDMTLQGLCVSDWWHIKNNSKYFDFSHVYFQMFCAKINMKNWLLRKKYQFETFGTLRSNLYFHYNFCVSIDWPNYEHETHKKITRHSSMLMLFCLVGCSSLYFCGFPSYWINLLFFCVLLMILIMDRWADSVRVLENFSEDHFLDDIWRCFMSL